MLWTKRNKGTEILVGEVEREEAKFETKTGQEKRSEKSERKREEKEKRKK